jgi:CRP-like cAMP-binding protein
MLGANDFFGEGCLAGQAQRIATVATITDSVIVRLEKAATVRVLHQEPTFSGMFIAHLLARAIRVEADLVDQLFNSSEKRLARLLLLLANFGKEEKPEPILAKISQETLAETRTAMPDPNKYARGPASRPENGRSLRMGPRFSYVSAQLLGGSNPFDKNA